MFVSPYMAKERFRLCATAVGLLMACAASGNALAGKAVTPAANLGPVAVLPVTENTIAADTARAPVSASIAKTGDDRGESVCPNGNVPPDKIKEMIRSEAALQGADLQLALAVADQESGFGRNNNSVQGARGPMQLIPSTARQYRVSDICDPVQNIRGGVAFLKDLNREFGGNIFLVLAAYNAGQKRVYAANGIPAIHQTVDYIARIANAYYGYGNTLRNNRAGLNTAARQPEAASGRDDQTIQPVNGPDEPRANEWVGGTVMYVEGK